MTHNETHTGQNGATLPYRHIRTLEQAKEQNRRAGFHFFSPDTLRYFSSRISQDTKAVSDGLLFVTSEQNRWSNEPRRYTVRFIRNDGSVETLGEFQEFATLRQAKAAMMNRAANWSGIDQELKRD